MKAHIITRRRLTKLERDELVELGVDVARETTTTRMLTPYLNPYFNEVWGDFDDLRKSFAWLSGVAVRAYITSKAELKTLGITSHIGMYDHMDTDRTIDLYFGVPDKLDARAKKNGFKTNVAWLFVHGTCHGRERLDTMYDRTHAMEEQGRLKELWYEHTVQIPNLKKQLPLYEQVVQLLKQLMTTPATLLHPVPEPYDKAITQSYGVTSSQYKLTGRHIGTDYGTPVGTKLRAPWSGAVTNAGRHPSLGNYCHFEYVFGEEMWEERWCHLAMVPTIKQYRRGETVALTGNTGMSTGPHFHRERWRNAVRIDLINRTNWAELTVDPERTTS